MGTGVQWLQVVLARHQWLPVKRLSVKRATRISPSWRHNFMARNSDESPVPGSEVRETDDNDPEKPVSEPYAEDTPLTWMFGDDPKTRIVAALLSERDRDLNKSDIARLAGISRPSVYGPIEDLVEKGIVVRTREVGNSPMFAINRESAAVRLAAELEEALIEQWYKDREP